MQHNRDLSTTVKLASRKLPHPPNPRKWPLPTAGERLWRDGYRVSHQAQPDQPPSRCAVRDSDEITADTAAPPTTHR